ncbi:MAG: hypothetical protein ACOWWM_10600 [Desulfobacterales bacterium]
MDTLESIQNRLDELEREIEEAKKRLPAHSIRPAHMAPLLELEDERDRLMARLEEIKARSR